MSEVYSKKEALNNAIAEAERFIKKAELAKKRLCNDEYAHFRCKEMAAAKRASADLTSALVFVRNPYRN